MTEYIVDESITTLHTDGLALALEGDFDEAQENFNAGLGQLRPLQSKSDLAFTALQESGLLRDKAFTSVRQAVKDGAEQSMRRLEAATFIFDQALEVTAPFVAGTAVPYSGAFKSLASKRQRRELFSAHAATLGLVARMVTATQVLFGEVEYGEKSKVIRDQFAYGTAHDLAKSGQNQYYATSNAMNAARQERINGRPVHVVPWLGRASMSIVRAAMRDRGNLWPSIRTTGRLLLSLRTRNAAVESVRHWRTI